MTTNFLLTQRTKNALHIEFNLKIWVESFLESKRAENLADGTIRFYEHKLKRFAEYCESNGVNTIPEITTDLIRQFFLYIAENGSNSGNVHAHFRAVKCFLRWFENEDEIDRFRNPIKKVKAPKNPERILDPVPLDDVSALISTCKVSTFTGVRNKALLMALLDTATRANEFLNIKMDDIDLVTGAVLIREGKGRKARIVAVTNKTRKFIRKYLRLRTDNIPYLWVSDENEQLSYDGLREVLRYVAIKAHIPAPTIHSFRRAYSINYLMNGGDLVSLARYLGHSNLATVQKYVKFLPEQILAKHSQFSPVNQLK